MTGLYLPVDELREHQQRGIGAITLTVDVLPLLEGDIIHP